MIPLLHDILILITSTAALSDIRSTYGMPKLRTRGALWSHPSPLLRTRGARGHSGPGGPSGHFPPRCSGPGGPGAYNLGGPGALQVIDRDHLAGLTHQRQAANCYGPWNVNCTKIITFFRSVKTNHSFWSRQTTRGAGTPHHLPCSPPTLKVMCHTLPHGPHPIHTRPDHSLQRLPLPPPPCCGAPSPHHH